MFKYKRVEWALRKIVLPVHRDGLVLDVGSGGTPYPRSDILLDRLTGFEHRCGDAMMVDRLAVYGDAQKMPFKSKAFDFIVASHILEHMSEPGDFLKELQRVGKAGYIETPNAIFERLLPYKIHCLEVMTIDGVLHIHKKAKPVEDSFLGTLNFLDQDLNWKGLFFERLDMFHVRFFWDSDIRFKIHNESVSCAWIESINAESEIGEEKNSYLKNDRGWRQLGLSVLNRWYAYWRSKRLKNFKLVSILCCPDCHGDLEEFESELTCQNCKVTYPFDSVPNFTRLNSSSSVGTSDEIGQN